jgi:2,5-diamino-6-(ribosylamino)-4(3H)-pyrimidinone 5'-phosphate reductase
VDSALQIPLSANALERAKTEKVIIATSARRDRAKEALLEKKGATVLVCGKDRVDLKKLFSRLPGFGIHSVLIEGGAKIASDAMDVGLADKAVVCISQKEIPRQGAVISPFTKNAFSKLKRKSIMGMGSDSLIEGYF